MKMMLAIMPASLSEQVSKTLLDSRGQVTKLASTAGFCAGSIITLMAGLEDDKFES